MALERQSIEKKDFPIGRRGYDPEAVDAHLRVIADEVEELRSSTRRRSETLASAASDQVRAIVEAAESSAAEILSQAEDEVREIRAEARSEARAVREQANAQASEHVDQVSLATAAMRERLDAMADELSTLLESLLTGSNRLDADLRLLAGNLAEVKEAAVPRAGRFEAETEPEPLASTTTGPAPGEIPPATAPEPTAAPSEPEPALAPSASEPAQAPAASEPVPEPEAGGPEAALAAAGGAEDGAEDIEGARLIALNMALNGTPREETDRYLAEHFELSDRSGLLDEVYASVGA